MIIPTKTFQKLSGSELECDRNDPPTSTVPQVCDSERYISPTSTCQSQGGVVIECDSTTTPVPGVPLSPRDTTSVTGDDTLS